MNRPTAVETRQAYNVIYDEDCTEEKAEEIVEEYMKLNAVFSGITMIKIPYIIDPHSTLEDFLTSRKRHEQDKAE